MMDMFMRRMACTALTLLCMSTVAVVQKRPASVRVVGHVAKPEELSPTAMSLQALKVPAGFAANVFAEGLGKPRMLEVTDDGSVYVTRREPGDVIVLRDTDGDGRSDEMRVAVRRPNLHGLAIVQVTSRNFEGSTHEFFGMGAVVPDAKEAVAFAAGELKKAFASVKPAGAAR